MQQVNFFDPQWHADNTDSVLFFIYDRGGIVRLYIQNDVNLDGEQR